MSNKNKKKRNKKTRKKRGGDGEYNEPCAICQERPATHQFCARGHYFCLECTTEWLSTVHNNMAGCPLCRAPYGRDYGHWWKKEIDLDVPAEVGSLMYKKVFGPCCSPCEKTCWDKLTCSHPKCYPCITDGLMIVGKKENKIQCKKRTRGGRRKKKTRKKGGVKVTKSPRKKTAIEIHREKLNNPEFKKRLFANKDTKVQIFEKAVRKRHADRVKHMVKVFREGWNSRFGKPTFMDNHIIGIFKQELKDPSKITDGDKKDIKLYREESAENRAKSYYVYTTFKEMKRRSDLMGISARRERERLKQEEEESITGTTGEIEMLEKEADKYHGGLEYLPPTPGRPYGVFNKTSIYEGNLGKTSPIPFVDFTEKHSVLMDDAKFDKDMFDRRGGRKKKRKTRRRKNKRKNKTKKNKSTKKMDKDFNPNLTPRQMFTMGSFGGTYWRPIKSKFHNTTLKNKHKKYSFLKGIPDNLMTRPFDKYDVKLNKYKKKVGTTLKFWENKGWMRESHPYGWVQWYCDYYSGKRSADDERQIKRWQQLAGPNGRFRKWLVTMILKKGGKWDDYSISPAIRQTLQHWGYKLTKKDFENEVKNRKK